MSVEELRQLADRLRKGRLIAPAGTIMNQGLGEPSTGETREFANPDAIAAADAIERLLSDRHQAEEAMRERCAEEADAYARGPIAQKVHGQNVAAAIRSIDTGEG